MISRCDDTLTENLLFLPRVSTWFATERRLSKGNDTNEALFVVSYGCCVQDSVLEDVAFDFLRVVLAVATSPRGNGLRCHQVPIHT